ncbi:hypothetical protein [Hyperthermus butylicus]|uniref:hypothetical protein n=1 Tax=Hyperthermus butylicus TaxID=54248 RepID=UPI0003245001|nr:hypothetical protein [Hyperthermus butylicus]
MARTRYVLKLLAVLAYHLALLAAAVLAAVSRFCIKDVRLRVWRRLSIWGSSVNYTAM